jgi:RNA polymerase sigma-70 factor (ECF subfamily)
VGSKSDVELVSAYRDGNRRAGEQLVDRYYAKVLNFCRSKAPNAANDITQRSFMACFERLDGLRDAAAFRSFLFGIVCNKIREHYRASRREGDKLDFGTVSSIDLDPSPTGLRAAQDEQRLMLDALRSIPLEYQMVLELFYWEDMGGAEIAQILDLPLGTAKTRLRRGRQLLEEQLAALADSPRLLERTATDLDAWARKLRELIDTADS